MHVGGTAEQIAAAELAVSRGRMPERPFVLVAQQYLADPSRSAGDVHPVWAYAHVPHGYPADRKLGAWLDVQRRRQREGRLAADRAARLDALGVVWTLREPRSRQVVSGRGRR